MGQPNINDATRPAAEPGDMTRPPLDIYERLAGVYDNGMVADVKNVRTTRDGDDPSGELIARV